MRCCKHILRISHRTPTKPPASISRPPDLEIRRACRNGQGPRHRQIYALNGNEVCAEPDGAEIIDVAVHPDEQTATAQLSCRGTRKH